MQNLAYGLAASTERNPDGVAMRIGNVVVSYAQLHDHAARVTALLRARGVEPGSRVGIMLPNIPAFAAVYYGILGAGCVVVPMNVLLKQREVKYYLEDSQASLLFAWHGFLDEAKVGADAAGVPWLEVNDAGIEPLLEGSNASDGDILERDGGDTAVILYTSGTTGTPKGAELTHDNLRRNAAASIGLFGLKETAAVVLGALPLFHSFGQTCGLNATITAGGCLSLLTRFDPTQALAIIERDGVNVFQGVPTMYSAMLATFSAADPAPDVSSLRVCVSGGASLPVEVLHGFEAAFGCAVLEGYGLSETSPVASFNHPDRERKAGSVGTPIEGVEIRVVDEQDEDVEQGQVGEFVIRGHNVMRGYWRREDATAETMRGGWFHSGDLGRVDGDGYLFIVDRSKDLILRGGYNVYPREVEEVLYEHPAVAAAAVVGVPHAELGQEVGAAVVRKPGVEVTEQELSTFVSERLAAYKYPRHVWFVEELPMSATGKILKREIDIPA